MKSDNLYYVCDEVKKVREMYHEIISDLSEYQTTFEFINALSISHYRQYAQGYPPSIVELKSWHPDCISKDYDYIMSLELAQTDIQYCQARQFGYKDWDHLIQQDQPLNHMYEQAVDAMLEGALDTLKELIVDHPECTTMSSPFAHGANLLLYMAANGVETHRQITPYNGIEITKFLLEQGVHTKPDHKIYGGNCTVIDLIETSAHPNEAGIASDVIELIRDHATS